MRIQRLEIENVKRISAVTIDPKGNVIVIGGQNGAGKTSTLDAIAMAIGGKRLCPVKPLRDGAKTGHVTITMDDGMSVTRTWTRDPVEGGVTSKIVVTSELMGSPQAVLDRLFSGLTFDPLAFTRMTAADQLTMLRQVAGVDTHALDVQVAAVYEERRAEAQTVKTLRAQLAGMTFVQDVPAEEIRIDDLIRARDEMMDRQTARDGFIEAIRERKEEDLPDIVEGIEAKKRAIADLQAQLTQMESARDQMIAAIEADEARMADCDPIDVTAFDGKIAAAQGTNRRVAENAQYTRAERGVTEAAQGLKALEDRLDAARAEREKLIAAAKFPVPGLTFSDAGILYNGQPFEQASSAEQLRVSVGMGLAMNPELKVLLIRDGSLLDEANMEMISEMADEADAQIWIERVGEGEEVSVVIEDGHVKAVELEEAADA